MSASNSLGVGVGARVSVRVTCACAELPTGPYLPMVNALRAVSAHLDTQPELMHNLDQAMTRFMPAFRAPPTPEEDERVARIIGEQFDFTHSSRRESPPGETFKALAMLLLFLYRLVQRGAVCSLLCTCASPSPTSYRRTSYIVHSYGTCTELSFVLVEASQTVPLCHCDSCLVREHSPRRFSYLHS